MASARTAGARTYHTRLLLLLSNVCAGGSIGAWIDSLLLRSKPPHCRASRPQLMIWVLCSVMCVPPMASSMYLLLHYAAINSNNHCGREHVSRVTCNFWNRPRVQYSIGFLPFILGRAEPQHDLGNMSMQVWHHDMQRWCCALRAIVCYIIRR